jgi:hypothetical protein
MFGVKEDTKQQNQDLDMPQPTVVTQSNVNLPDTMPAPLMPDAWQAPSDINSQALPPVAASTGPPSLGAASSSPNPPDVGPATSAVFTAKNDLPPEVSLDAAYIATDPAHIKDSKSSEKPTAASLMNRSSENELMKMKQKALQSLAPLVDHLDQSPEEKFKTTMMLIQASDNAELVKDAYDAANQIKDDKVRAQALLDIVNEINYFTHSPVAGTATA